MNDRLNDLLSMLIENKNVDDWVCLNRLEQYLICILTKSGLDGLGEPLNRLEVLLQALYYAVPEDAVEVIATRLEELE